MGQIFKEIGLLGAKNKFIKIRALFDTGAKHNYIAEVFRDGSSIYDLGILELMEKQPIIFPNGTDIDGRMIKLKLLKIDGIAPIPEPTFCLFDMKMCDVIIGTKLMQELKIVLYPTSHEISFA